MKRNALLIIILSVCLSISASAHPGRTDSSGGHKDNQNQSGLGYYHYHCGGHEPHLHPNGICKYNRIPIEGYNSSNDYFTPEDAQHMPDNSDTNFWSMTKAFLDTKWAEYCLYGFFFIIIIRWIMYLVSDSKERNRKSEKEKREKEEKFTREYEYYFSIYAFYDPKDFVDIPKGTYIKDGLPCTNGQGIYGSYSTYISRTGKCYHARKSCMKSEDIRDVNIYYARNIYYPCSRCVKYQIDLSWYEEYRRIVNIKKKYNIP